jgi:hypothetical protein
VQASKAEKEKSKNDDIFGRFAENSYFCEEKDRYMTDNVQPQDGLTHHLNQMYQNWFLDYA